MEENPEDAIITEEREELMVSLSGRNPTRRTAHFLKPSVTSTEGPVFHLPSGAFRSPTSSTTPNVIALLKVEFRGCRDPARKWKAWFDRMHSLHQSTWKKAGIYEAIMNSTYQVRVDRDIVVGFAQRWCSDTNTFVFDWGEGTITLEDVLVLGGYSVLGDSVLRPLETRELIEIDEKLMEGRREITRGKANKANHCGWVRLFMGTGSEIEHEAFLVLWLSRHVFPYGYSVINRNVHSIAIHLARGTRIALAPAVLSWLYRDLRLLKNAIFSGKKQEVGLNLWAPMQMVQIWAWERYPSLRPQPNSLKPGEPRMARWSTMKKKHIENVGLAINSGRDFQWCPYAKSEENWEFPMFYKEREEWVSCLGMDEYFESFARFLRPSELVGLDCLERYLPHRVAMQFGMDQDVPGLVARFNETPEIAWENYSRPIRGRLYVPSRLFKSDVTARYLEWWKQSKLSQKDTVKGAKGKKSITESPRKPLEDPKGKSVENNALGTPPKRKRVNTAKSGGKDEKSITKSLGKLLQIPNGMNVEIDALHTPPKRKRVKGVQPVRKDEHIIKGVQPAGNTISGDGKCIPQPKPQIPSAADNGAGKKMESPVEFVKNTVRRKALMGGSHISSENASENSVGIPRDEKSITKSLGKSLQIPKVMNVENDALHTSPKKKRVGVQPVGEAKHRIEDSAGNRISGDGKCFAQPKPQIPSSLTADNGSGKKMESPVELVENPVSGEAMMGGSDRTSENASENSVGIPRDDGVSVASNGGNIRTQSTIDISGLEVRTSRLEKVFAQLKAEKLRVRSV